MVRVEGVRVHRDPAVLSLLYDVCCSALHGSVSMKDTDHEVSRADHIDVPVEHHVPATGLGTVQLDRDTQNCTGKMHGELELIVDPPS